MEMASELGKPGSPVLSIHVLLEKLVEGEHCDLLYFSKQKVEKVGVGRGRQGM